MPPIDRRHVLRGLAAVTALPLLSGCGSSGPRESATPPGEAPSTGGAFLHGVASGDPLADRVIIWTRVTPADPDTADALPVRWQVATDADFGSLSHEGQAFAEAERDYTLKVDLLGLQSGTTYFYRFLLDDALSPVGRTRTAPEGPVSALHFAVACCSDWRRGLYNAYARIAERDELDAVLHLGDYLYENGRDGPVRPQEPLRELRTLEDYRLRYAALHSDAALAEVHRRHPMIWVWDDHEVVDGAWLEGGDPSNHDDAEDGPYRLRRAAAFRAAHEWLPIRTPDPADLSRIFRKFSFGDLVDLVMIDSRHFGRAEPIEPRDLLGEIPVFSQAGAFADPQRQMLGAEQEDWLREQLTTSQARWRLIGNQVVFSPIKALGLPQAAGGGLFVNPDQWDGYHPARVRVAEMIEASAGNVVILTGDVHAGIAFDVSLDPNNPLSYDPVTQRGAIAVELVAPSISSASDPSSALEGRLAGLAQVLRLINVHGRYVSSGLNGYLLLEVTPERCRAEYWNVPTVTVETSEEFRDAVFEVASGEPKLTRIRRE